METAGLVLAVLPLLLNQMDNYVQGIETFKLLRSKHYRRELERYKSNLKTQEAILKNTLLGLVNDLVEYEDDVDDLIQNPLGYLLSRETLRSLFRKKLGTSFDAFIQTMAELANLLNDLYRKLGWEIGQSVNNPKDKSYLRAELRKFKDIFSKSIYEDMITRIGIANGLLKTLAEQADRRAVIQENRITTRPLLLQRKVRESACSLHTTIISGRCWKCSCRDRHAVHFMLKHPDLSRTERQNQSSSDSRFRMIFAYMGGAGDSGGVKDLGLEIETESDTSPSVYALKVCPPQCVTGQTAIHKGSGLIVQGDAQTVTITPQDNAVPTILDFCVSLSTIRVSGEPNKIFGYFSDESHRHNLYYVRSLAAGLEMKSLSELITDSTDFFKASASGHFLTQKQRLRLSVNLACSVLQFHGSWLRTHWRAKDILFNTATDIENPFVQWNIGKGDHLLGSHGGKGKGRASSPLIQSEILLPLGLVLVELSLCQTLETLRSDEDRDLTESCTDLKTAARYIDLVAQQSGIEYKRVVKTCLFWPGDEELDLDSDEVQDDMFRQVISPLIENMRIFEGERKPVKVT
ncbi:hypothetical protein N7540_000211 [Penicillium herquei]|nr:hypothetical protein N7540_000211 [Penicillium herquei]